MAMKPSTTNPLCAKILLEHNMTNTHNITASAGGNDPRPASSRRENPFLVPGKACSDVHSFAPPGVPTSTPLLHTVSCLNPQYTTAPGGAYNLKELCGLLMDWIQITLADLFQSAASGLRWRVAVRR